MTFRRSNTHAATAAVILAILLACSVVALTSGNSAAMANPSRAASVPASLLSAATPQRVHIVLRSQSLASDAADRAAALASAGSAQTNNARRRAAANPYLLTDQEKMAARRVERTRTLAMRQLRRAAEPDVAASEQLASVIEHGGGEVHQATPLPNTITATLPARLIKALAANPLISSIAPAGDAPHAMSSPVDGSETWHLAGSTGNGTSADGKGGPDYAFPDAGARTTHLAFRTRLPGDPTNGPATGPTRITSPPGRTNFSGSEHGNTVAAIVITTDLTTSAWQYRKGLAYGIDKAYDPIDAESPWHWMTGVTYSGEPGVSDVPEAINYSAGNYDDTLDQDPGAIFMDSYIANLGITFSIAAGNCGYQNTGFTNCGAGVGPHRIVKPSTNFNSITVGGIDYNGDIYNSGVWIPWAVSSPGPTWGGRKKPDLLADPFGVASGPNDQDDTTYENTGEGTSYAAPVASAGALLLASSGVYQPTAQKAILINSATQFGGRTYWTPKAGWGVIDLDQAFVQRANYANSTITPQGENGVRFFRITGVTSSDRSTLVWNRRTSNSSTYRPLTDLDLSQHNQATGATTATGGSDAADTVDTDQTITAENPMPGNGTDGGDNVEQVRSTSSGTQVLKVKTLGSVDGLAAEPFSVASSNSLTPLETPVPETTLEVLPNTIGLGGSATVTATVRNTSSDIPLTDASVVLTPPAGVTITNGEPTQDLATLTEDESDTAVWQVQGTTSGFKTLTADSEGTAYGETFAGEATDTLTVDNEPPEVTVTGPGEWSASADAAFSWSATDASGVASYDVSTSINDGTEQLQLDDTTATSSTFSAPEGSKLTVFVRATDSGGNQSAAASASTTIDAVAPTVSISAPVISPGFASVQVSAHNVGSPVSVMGAFSQNAGAPLFFLKSPTLGFENSTAQSLTAIARAQATDLLGRVATASLPVSVPSKYIAARLKIKKPHTKRGVTTIAGSLNKAVTGRVKIVVKRVGRRGTKKRTAYASIKRGRFSARVRLAPGRYRISATSPAAATVLSSTTHRSLTVR